MASKILNKISNFFWKILIIEFFAFLYLAFRFVWHQFNPPVDNGKLFYNTALVFIIIGVVYELIFIILMVVNIRDRNKSLFFHNLLKLIVQLIFIIIVIILSYALLIFGL